MYCSCGTQNNEQAQFCRNCGKPLKETVDMRYEGATILSKKKRKNSLERLWALFANVKFGVSLIVLTLVMASLGTILPQVLFIDTSTFSSTKEAYKQAYGVFGEWYYILGFADLYNSWWFQALIGCLAASIIVASLDRGIPLFKALRNQRVQKHPLFFQKQRLQLTSDASISMEAFAQQLKKQNYRVRVENENLLAEKGRFSRWGPYINHVGLILFLAGVMMRLIPGFYVDEKMWVREGDTTSIPEATGYYIENKQFVLETYGDEETDAGINSVAKQYATDVNIYKNKTHIAGADAELQRVTSGTIEVNHPLKFDGYALYQMDYRQNELKSMTFSLMNKRTEKSFGTFTIDLMHPKKEYKLDEDTSVQIEGYYPDFEKFDATGEPISKSPNPNNPAFLVKMVTKEYPLGETSFVQIKKTLEPLGETAYKVVFERADTRDVSGLKVHKDRTWPLLLLGGIIFMLGVCIGSYFNHRRIWVKRHDDQLLIAAHTNKNWHSMKKDTTMLTDALHLQRMMDTKEQEEK